MIQTHDHGILQSSFSPLQSNIPITILLAGSVLVVLQKNNNVVVRRHFCEMPLMLTAIFVRWCF